MNSQQTALPVWFSKKDSTHIWNGGIIVQDAVNQHPGVLHCFNSYVRDVQFSYCDWEAFCFQLSLKAKLAYKHLL
jgi:hypothetical protein